MNMSNHPYRFVSVCGVMLLALTVTVGARSGNALTVPETPTTSETQDTLESTPFDNIRSTAWDTADGKYVVHLDDVPTALKSSTMQTWCVRVTDSQGKVARGIKLDFTGGMPQHGHGLPSVPATTVKNGKCPYRIDGIEFHMPGVWQVGFVITTRSGTRHEIKRFVNVN